MEAADGFHLWSERYGRALADVSAIQDEIGNRWPPIEEFVDVHVS
jgi:TolB-like protein